MVRAILALLVAVPLLAELPPGVTRVTYPHVSTAFFFAATPNDVLWVAALLDQDLLRVEPAGAAQRLTIPLGWRGTRDMTVGPDGALWLGGEPWIVRVDPVTNAIERWALGPSHVGFLLSGPDGNIWFTQHQSPTVHWVVRMRTDGTVLSAVRISDSPRGAAFGTDGALYLSLPGKLLRVTPAGEQTTFPTTAHPRLFYGLGFLWSGVRSLNAPVLRPAGEIVKLSYRGEILATYRIAMEPVASDALGNLWLREATAEGDVVGQLTPAGVLTRFGPLPALPSNECHRRWYGGLAFLTDGRVAISDYYPDIPRTLIDPCIRVPKPAEFRNTATILDPRIAPVLSVQSLSGPFKRRSVRH